MNTKSGTQENAITINEALEYCRRGERIKRKSWDNLYVAYLSLYDYDQQWIDRAFVVVDSDGEYIGLFDPEPRDERLDDWMVIE